MATDNMVRAINDTLRELVIEIRKLREAAERIAASHPEPK